MNKLTGRRGIDDEANDILAILDRPDPKASVRNAAQALQQARDAGECGLRYEHLRQAQQHMRQIDPRRHGRELQQLQGEALALQGRGGDTRIAHVSPRELVIPHTMQTPDFMRLVAQHARRSGIDPNRLVVDSPRGRVNPRTGRQEFTLMGLNDRDSGTSNGDYVPFDEGPSPNSFTFDETQDMGELPADGSDWQPPDPSFDPFDGIGQTHDGAVDWSGFDQLSDGTNADEVPESELGDMVADNNGQTPPHFRSPRYTTTPPPLPQRIQSDRNARDIFGGLGIGSGVLAAIPALAAPWLFAPAAIGTGLSLYLNRQAENEADQLQKNQGK